MKTEDIIKEKVLEWKRIKQNKTKSKNMPFLLLQAKYPVLIKTVREDTAIITSEILSYLHPKVSARTTEFCFKYTIWSTLINFHCSDNWVDINEDKFLSVSPSRMIKMRNKSLQPRTDLEPSIMFRKFWKFCYCYNIKYELFWIIFTHFHWL